MAFIAEPLYIVTKRIRKGNSLDALKPPNLTTEARNTADEYAQALAARGYTGVVYECKIVTVVTPTNKCVDIRKERVRRKRVRRSK